MRQSSRTNESSRPSTAVGGNENTRNGYIGMLHDNAAAALLLLLLLGRRFGEPSCRGFW